MNKSYSRTIFIFFLLFMVGCGKKLTPAEEAFSEAQKLYAAALQRGENLSVGPCLSNALYPNVTSPEEQWVVDIAHYPRTEQDNFEVNQCSAYIKGEAKHFIELDPGGNLIKFF